MNNKELNNIKTIQQLWKYTDLVHKKNYPDSKLKPIMSGGELERPKYMFVFINPTHRNVSSGANWQGLSRPWVGTKYIWKIFYNSGNFSKELLDEINSKKDWDQGFANKVYKELEGRSFYFTNIVKWTGKNADLPNAEKINLFTPILKKEIQIIKPDFVVTFGLIPYKGLTGNSIKLYDVYENMLLKKQLQFQDHKVGTHTFKLVPCYFPVGRGNPKRATEILSYLK